MRIVKARQISQLFFFVLFLWFCTVSTVGDAWWQLRGWPVNWFLQLDPLVALGTMLATGALYAGLLWALVTVGLTIFLGRFFCSWVCPFGTIHHLVGFLANRTRTLSEKVARNRYHPAQSVKYVILVFLLGAAAGDLMAHPPKFFLEQFLPWGLLLSACLFAGLVFTVTSMPSKKSAAGWLGLFAGAWILFGWFLSGHDLVGASLQTGLLDPIPLMHRSVNLVALSFADGATHTLATGQRYTQEAWLIGMVFMTAVLLNLRVPRFYCRYLCPLGALFGVLGRHALWRMGSNEAECSQCKKCEAHCEGACGPSREIRINECVLCMNCLDSCGDGFMGYRPSPSAAGEIAVTDLSRRGFVLSLISGVVAVPVTRLEGALGSGWAPGVVRPPGALAEDDFLKRCIKCGQCMRACPTNVIHPAGMQAGWEGLWTPVLDFRVGTSGCQYNCIACGHVCPTAAIRPITLDEKHGKNDFAEAGPVSLGTAFVDRGRCLPWAMDRPCIVCQENCPVSPKAIFTRQEYVTIRNGRFPVKAVHDRTVVLDKALLAPQSVATGDYFCLLTNQGDALRAKILENTQQDLVLGPDRPWPEAFKPGTSAQIQVLLKKPFVSPERCIGCGICEHECPVSGKRAIRVTAENESRSKRHALLIR